MNDATQKPKRSGSFGAAVTPRDGIATIKVDPDTTNATPPLPWEKPARGSGKSKRKARRKQAKASRRRNRK